MSAIHTDITPARILFSTLSFMPAVVVNIINAYQNGSISLTRREQISFKLQYVIKDHFYTSSSLIKALEEKQYKLATHIALEINDLAEIFHLAVQQKAEAVEFIISQAQFNHYEKITPLVKQFNGAICASIIATRGYKGVCKVEFSSPAEVLGTKITLVLLEIWKFLEGSSKTKFRSVPHGRRSMAVELFVGTYLKRYPIIDCSLPLPSRHILKQVYDMPCDCYEDYAQVAAKYILNEALTIRNFKIAKLFIDRGLKPEVCVIDCLLEARIVEFKPKKTRELTHVRVHPVFRDLSVKSVEFWLKCGLDVDTELHRPGIKGLTILMAAVRIGSLEAVRVLKREGADRKIEFSEKTTYDHHTETPLECAQRLGHLDIVKQLE